ncbi:MAG: aspartate/glutamate racemase family protein [Sneathiella sp.]|uniref:aspartate/glutamate racemase family protein n=1 Tax=Sneathiella sp. TaxID=1964365 RepID=UPI0030013B23
MVSSKMNLLKDREIVSFYSGHIGLIGGLAFRAGIFYYDQILRHYNEAGKKLDLSIRHADVNTVLAHVGKGDPVGLGSYLSGLANELFDAGVDHVTVTAVAPHLAIDEISKNSNGPIVNLLETVRPILNDLGLERVAIFGNRAVLLTDMFGAVPEKSVVKLNPDVLETVHETYNDIALFGKRNTPVEVEYLNGVADNLMRQGAQAIILAGTDLSSFYSEVPPEFPHIDMAKLHVEQILTRT